MLGRQTKARIKAAEDALAAGRIDDALEAATDPDVQADRKAASLLAKIGEALLERGQNHLLERRFAAALSDFNRAARCGLSPARIADWLRRAEEANEADVKSQRDRAAALALVRERLDAGSLATAANMLEGAAAQIGNDVRAASLASEISERQEQAALAMRAAQAAWKINDWQGTAVKLRAVRALDRKFEGLADMVTKLSDSVLKQAGISFVDGRLRRAEQELAVLEGLDVNRAEVVDLREAVSLARQAARALAEDHYRQAGVLIGRLAKVGPSAKWVAQVRDHLDRVDSHRRALLEGPLGLILEQESPAVAQGRISADADTLCPQQGAEPRRTPAPPVHVPELPNVVAAGNGLARRLLLRIDGIGSFLLVRGERVSIGRAGPGATADIQLVSDLSDRHAEIINAGEDYFVYARSGVDLAGRQVAHALLQDGDRVRLGSRVRLKFRRPSLKSTAAALDMGEGVRTTTDCRRAILWTGPILIGPTRECHIIVPPSIGDYVLLSRDGKVQIRTAGPRGSTTPVNIGSPVRVGDLSLRLTSWDDVTPLAEKVL